MIALAVFWATKNTEVSYNFRQIKEDYAFMNIKCNNKILILITVTMHMIWNHPGIL